MFRLILLFISIFSKSNSLPILFELTLQLKFSREKYTTPINWKTILGFEDEPHSTILVNRLSRNTEFSFCIPQVVQFEASDSPDSKAAMS